MTVEPDFAHYLDARWADMVGGWRTRAAGSRASPAVPDRLSIGQFDVVVQSVTTAAGGTAHLLDSSRRTDDGGAIRLSETGRRAVVVCDAEGVCAEPQTMVMGSQRIQLG